MFPFLPGKKGLTFVCYIIIPVNMKHQSEKPLAPYSFSRCFNAQCAKAETCLHRLAAVRDTPEYPSIRVINPLCIPADSSKCPYFQSAQKAHVAWGISHLLDDVPYKYLHTLKNRLIAHFGRGRGAWRAAESPPEWKDQLQKLLSENDFRFEHLRDNPTSAQPSLVHHVDGILRKIFESLYGRGA